jgi:hypothetical protein
VALCVGSMYTSHAERPEVEDYNGRFHGICQRACHAQNGALLCGPSDALGRRAGWGTETGGGPLSYRAFCCPIARCIMDLSTASNVSSPPTRDYNRWLSGYSGITAPLEPMASALHQSAKAYQWPISARASVQRGKRHLDVF